MYLRCICDTKALDLPQYKVLYLSADSAQVQSGHWLLAVCVWGVFARCCQVRLSENTPQIAFHLNYGLHSLFLWASVSCQHNVHIESATDDALACEFIIDWDLRESDSDTYTNYYPFHLLLFSFLYYFHSLFEFRSWVFFCCRSNNTVFSTFRFFLFCLEKMRWLRFGQPSTSLNSKMPYIG